MKLEEFEKHNWKEDDKIYVVTIKLKNHVFVPDSIVEEHYQDNPGYYKYIYDRVFCTEDDARKGFAEVCLRTRKTIKRKEINELKKIDAIREYINQLKEIEDEVKAKQVEYNA